MYHTDVLNFVYLWYVSMIHMICGFFFLIWKNIMKFDVARPRAKAVLLDYLLDNQNHQTWPCCCCCCCQWKKKKKKFHNIDERLDCLSVVLKKKKKNLLSDLSIYLPYYNRGYLRTIWQMSRTRHVLNFQWKLEIRRKFRLNRKHFFFFFF